MLNLRDRRAITSAILGVSLFVGTATPVAAQTSEGTVAAQISEGTVAAQNSEDAVDAELVGYTVAGEPMTDADWVDPVALFEISSDDLAPLPDFDVSIWHDSTVFAAGVDRVAVEGDDTESGVELNKHVERQRRVLQAVASLDGLIDTNADEIAARRPRVGRLVQSIDRENEQEARLTREVDTLNQAIAEFAVRAFIGDDDLETALSVPQTGLSETRVVTDEIRGDQIVQIEARETELIRRQRRRIGLQDDLVILRDELLVLREKRARLFDQRRELAPLSPRIEAAYKLALHERLPKFVDDSDIPLVALNAYVIAERRLAEEQPQCQIEWWMLAGVGKIESLHGYFGNSTLNANGHTTEAIRGPALDGRILSGEEFVTDGATAPAATGRTEEQSVTITPATTPTPVPTADAPEAPASAATPGEIEGEAGDPAAAPVPVIKRLALIVDSDGGRLDGDTTYDRAVGPMQFIPQTWQRYEADGNADDQSDPQNIYDAALASARYLCAATSSMATAEGRQTAFFAYNHDEEYSANVAATGEHYRSAIQIPTDEFGSAFFLGISDPERDSIQSETIEDLKTLEDLLFLDW